jgi:outer membrane protein assembly factor BamB
VEKGVPATFSKTENVLWTAPMRGPAAATPIVWGKHVFISTVDPQKQTLLAVCLDRATGEVLWEHEVAQGIRRDDRSNYASSSPVTDGNLVFFFYGNGDLVAFDFSGNKVWGRNIQKDYGPFAFLWTFSASPMLYEGRLYIQVLQRDVPVSGRGRKDGPNDSYLLALDPKTGRELWKQIRHSEARQESREAFSTPIPYTHTDRAELLVIGGDAITGHDPATGRELWRWGTWNPQRITHWRMVPSPVAGAGIVLACAPKRAPVYAIKAGLSGDLDDSALAWASKDRAVSSDVSTPLFYKDRFFILNSDLRVLSCVEPASGRVLWTGDLESRAKLEASPTGADGKIFMVNHQGDVFIVGTGDTFELLHTANMGDETDGSVRSSIAVSDGQLFIRTESTLFCIGTRP